MMLPFAILAVMVSEGHRYLIVDPPLSKRESEQEY